MNPSVSLLRQVELLLNQETNFIKKAEKESLLSNLKIVSLWHQALEFNDVATSWVEYLIMIVHKHKLSLENPTQRVDLIVPRGESN
jgi:glutamate-5-semialdehyde dehydrogenase